MCSQRVRHGFKWRSTAVPRVADPSKRAQGAVERGAMDLLAHTTRPPGFMAPPIDSSSSCSEGEWQADPLPLPGSDFSPGNQHAPEDDVQALSLAAEGIDSDDPFVAHGGMRSVGGLSSYVSPSNRLSGSPVSEAYTCSDSGGALSMDDHWEPGTASRPVALPASRTSWPQAAPWPSHAPLELSAHSPAHVERGGDASGAVYEDQAESLDAVEHAAAAAATAVGTEVAVTAAAEDMAAAAEGGVAPALMQSSVISLCAVGDDTHLRAHLSRTRAQLHAAQLQLQRATGALATTREQLSESEAERRTLQLRAEGLHASGGGAGEAAAAAGGGGGGGRSALVELAERRLAELEDELRRKDEQLQQLQACRPRPPPRAPPRRAAP